MGQASKQRFFAAISRYEANSPVLARFDIYFRVEDREDIPFWEKVLSPHVKGLKVKFVPCVERSGKKITGKSYILKSIDAAGPQYILCIDSDFDYLLDRGNLSAERFVLQTYTYSWENHYCRKEPLKEMWDKHGSGVAIGFDFIEFFKKLNTALYEPLILLLMAKHKGKRRLTLDSICTAISKIQPNSQEMLKDNGEKIISALKQNLTGLFDIPACDDNTDDEINEFRTSMLQKGLDGQTAYLYMQGHAVYDLVERMGRALYGNSFEYQILLQTFDERQKYPELDKIKEDISLISSKWGGMVKK